MRGMEGRRIRRFGRAQNNQTLLPVRLTRLSNTVSCWYCDFKTSFLNEPLFRFGRRHSRCLRVWFSVGLGFSLTALLGVILILLWEFGGAVCLYRGNDQLRGLLNGSLFGFSSSISGSTMSLPDVGYIFLSSILAVFIHEVGHALAAASEGIQMEYIAVFLAVLFPGALVAFNDELLQALPKTAALRIYCAGIWHNATFCMGCALVLFLLPLILDPFYIHGESPMVLYVSPMSPLSGYLSPLDLIISLEGNPIHDVQEWKETIALLNGQMLQNLANSGDFKASKEISSRIGYCVPSYLIRESVQPRLEGNDTTCPSELFAFAASPCLDSPMLDDVSTENHLRGTGNIYCLNPKDVIKLKKCGDNGVKDVSNRSTCSCSEDESFFSPVQMPGLAWVEITYSRPSPGCEKLSRSSSPGSTNSGSGELNCISSFTFVGDLMTLGHALHLTSYQPRWSTDIGAFLPNSLEKLFICAFHVSLSLALLNSLPVYFLDGECILESVLQYLSFLLRPRTRRKVLQWVLVGGTCISALIFFRLFFVKL